MDNLSYRIIESLKQQIKELQEEIENLKTQNSELAGDLILCEIRENEEKLKRTKNKKNRGNNK